MHRKAEKFIDVPWRLQDEIFDLGNFQNLAVASEKHSILKCYEVRVILKSWCQDVILPFANQIVLSIRREFQAI